MYYKGAKIRDSIVLRDPIARLKSCHHVNKEDCDLDLLHLNHIIPS